MKLYIRTKYGDQYHVAENGDITRLDQPGFKPSGQWKLLGIQHVRRNEFIPRAELFARFSGLTPGTSEHESLKNGKPQWTVRDLDHGTTRVWGNTEYHGLEDIRVIREEIKA